MDSNALPLLSIQHFAHGVSAIKHLFAAIYCYSSLASSPNNRSASGDK